MSMVERVARAIDDEVFRQACDGSGLGEEGARLAARAAIEAMREPTEAMVRAGEDIDAVAPRWHCMIDEALAEKSP